MSVPTQASPVIIIGAGLAGLALAQSLKQASPPIPFYIYERDESTTYRSQGYRIRISPVGAAALRKLLPHHLYEAFENTCASVTPGFGSKLGAVSGELVPTTTPQGSGGNGPKPEFMAGKSFNADRAVLRNILLDGLDEHVSFGKRYVKCVMTPGGGVQVHFADGSTAAGSIVIGADGSRSAVREQILPTLNVLDSEGRAVFGKTYLTAELQAHLPAEMTSGMSMVVEPDDKPIKMLCDPMRFDDSLNPDLRGRYHVPDNYIYWVLCFREDACPVDGVDLMHSTSQDARQLSLKFAEHWHEDVRRLFEEQDTPSASTLSFTICDPKDYMAEWNLARNAPLNGVATLLGDAAHPMTPVGGIGANTAFQEAADLAQSLKGLYCSDTNNFNATAALDAYQDAMVVRGEEMLKNSISGAGHFFDMRSIEELKLRKQPQ